MLKRLSFELIARVRHDIGELLGTEDIRIVGMREAIEENCVLLSSFLQKNEYRVKCVSLAEKRVLQRV